MAARWHAQSCLHPNIKFSSPGAGLHCETCKGALDLVLLRQQQVNSPSFLPIPPDEPLGQLNLQWPPTVHYEGNDPGKPYRPMEEKRVDGELGDAVHLLMYKQTLTGSEIRLLHLSPSPSTDDPIHLTLEVFQQDDCPEYEAVSYTWGGEDGDSSPVEPVYVGQFWDVLLQTRNCDAMLRYLRRRDRRRTLWVDAICINQQNASEKSAQIPLMATIFKSAMRVIAYLESRVKPGSDRNFPSRTFIGDLKKNTVEGMLKRRYFSRLWVVQELILARSVVFIFGGFECHAQASMMPTLPWPRTPTPWLQHLGAQSFAVEEDLVDVLHLTRTSACADIRDLCFGTLGLAQQEVLRGLQPDYRLSALQLFVGVATHCIINEDRQSDVFLNCIGAGGWGKQPSWVPDWSAGGGQGGLARIWKPDPDAGERRRMVRLLRDEIADRIVPVVWCKVNPELRVYQPRASLFPSASFQPSVNAMTGALSLQLIYFSPINKISPMPETAKPGGTERGWFWALVHGPPYDLVIVSYSKGPSEMIQQGRDHIFYTKQGLPMVLRECDGPTNKFSIVMPLQSVWILSRNDMPGPPDYFVLPDLVKLDLISSARRGKHMPSCHVEDGSLVMSPALERSNPRLALLRDSRIGLRLRHQIFAPYLLRRDLVRNMLVFLCSVLRLGSTDEIGLDRDTVFREGFGELAKSQYLGGRSRIYVHADESTGTEHIVFPFWRDQFDYVQKWFIQPLYQEAEDPDGSRTRREQPLVWGTLPVWEWYDHKSERWTAAAGSEPLLAVLSYMNPVRLRAPLSSVISYLWRNSWDLEVMRELCIKCNSMLPRQLGALGVQTPVGLLDVDKKALQKCANGSEELDSAFDVSTDEPGRYNFQKAWPQKSLRQHPLSGKHMLVTIV